MKTIIDYLLLINKIVDVSTNDVPVGVTVTCSGNLLLKYSLNDYVVLGDTTCIENHLITIIEKLEA